MAPASIHRLRLGLFFCPAVWGCRPTGQAFLAPAASISLWLSPNWSSVSPGCRPPSHLSARTETWPKDAPVADRSCGEAARLRELAPGFAEGASLHLQRRIHSATLRALPPPSRLPESGGTSEAALRSCAVPLTHPPVPVGKYWTEKPLAGRAMDRVASAAAQDVASAEPGQCSRTRTALPCGRQAIGSHLLATFLCEQKGSSLAGRREKRLPSLATANMRAEEGGRRETLDQTGDSQQVSSGRRRLDETLDAIDVSPATDAAN